jgi:hypothetical protein
MSTATIFVLEAARIIKNKAAPVNPESGAISIAT